MPSSWMAACGCEQLSVEAETLSVVSAPLVRCLAIRVGKGVGRVHRQRRRLLW